MRTARLPLRSYFEQLYRPTYLGDSKPGTIVEYLTTVTLFERLIGSRQLAKISVEDLANFKTKLLEQPGRARETLSRATVNKHLTNINALLTKAGPRGKVHKLEQPQPLECPLSTHEGEDQLHINQSETLSISSYRQ